MVPLYRYALPVMGIVFTVDLQQLPLFDQFECEIPMCLSMPQYFKVAVISFQQYFQFSN